MPHAHHELISIPARDWLRDETDGVAELFIDMPLSMLKPYVHELAVAFTNEAARDGVRIDLSDMQRELHRYASRAA